MTFRLTVTVRPNSAWHFGSGGKHGICMKIQVAAQPCPAHWIKPPDWHLKVQLSRGFWKMRTSQDWEGKNIWWSGYLGRLSHTFLGLHLPNKWIIVLWVLRRVINFFKRIFYFIFTSSWKLNVEHFLYTTPDLRFQDWFLIPSHRYF